TQRLVQLVFERAHFVDRHRRVERSDGAAQLSEHRGRVRVGADIKRGRCRIVELKEGYEHLPVDAFARPFVKRVFGNSDDLDIEFDSGAVAKTEMTADCGTVSEVVRCELSIDDRHRGFLPDIAAIEVTAFE